MSSDRLVRSDWAQLEPRQRRVLELLEERARRTELLAALVGAGGLPRERAATILCSELGELETAAGAAGMTALVAMTCATRKVVEHLGGVADADRPLDDNGELGAARWRQREVIVLDDNEVTRDLITLALQADGHRVRSAANVGEISALVRERKPHVLLTEARLPGAPAARFCNYLRVTMALEKIPIVIFSSARGDELAMLAHEAGADLYLSKDQGIGDLMREITQLFEEILW